MSTSKHTPGPWLVKAGRNIETSNGTFYLTYGKDRYGNPLFRDFVELDHNAQLTAAGPAMHRALRQLYELRHIMLARTGAAGHRQTSDGTWVCDPWTQAFKDAGEALEQADTGQRPTGERGWV